MITLENSRKRDRIHVQVGIFAAAAAVWATGEHFAWLLADCHPHIGRAAGTVQRVSKGKDLRRALTRRWRAVLLHPGFLVLPANGWRSVVCMNRASVFLCHVENHSFAMSAITLKTCCFDEICAGREALELLISLLWTRACPRSKALL